MKQHPLCTDTEHGPNVMDLPIPAGLKQEWVALANAPAVSRPRRARCWVGRRWPA